MKGLLVKDMLYLRQNLSIFALSVFLVVMCAVITAITGKVPAGIGVVATAFICLLPIAFIADDQRTGFEKTVAYSPISKDDMVRARYLLMLVLSLAGGVILSLVLGTAALIGSAPMGKVLVAAMLFMVTMLVLPSVCLPLIYYFKKTTSVMVVSMAVTSGLSMGSAIWFKNQLEISLSAAAVMFAVSLVMTAVSYVISVKIFRKTDIC
jgi:ABC-type transport system involved in multi-copper enzyme maturation permease subunit